MVQTHTSRVDDLAMVQRRDWGIIEDRANKEAAAIMQVRLWVLCVPPSRSMHPSTARHPSPYSSLVSSQTLNAAKEVSERATSLMRTDATQSLQARIASLRARMRFVTAVHKVIDRLRLAKLSIQYDLVQSKLRSAAALEVQQQGEVWRISPPE